MTFGRKLALTGAAWSVALLMAAPIIWMALTAFKTDLDALQFPPKLVFWPTLENFASANTNISVVTAAREQHRGFGRSDTPVLSLRPSGRLRARVRAASAA